MITLTPWTNIYTGMSKLKPWSLKPHTPGQTQAAFHMNMHTFLYLVTSVVCVCRHRCTLEDMMAHSWQQEKEQKLKPCATATNTLFTQPLQGCCIIFTSVKGWGGRTGCTCASWTCGKAKERKWQKVTPKCAVRFSLSVHKGCSFSRPKYYAWIWQSALPALSLFCLLALCVWLALQYAAVVWYNVKEQGQRNDEHLLWNCCGLKL